jgi:hypothetical protein
MGSQFAAVDQTDAATKPSWVLQLPNPAGLPIAAITDIYLCF